MHRPIPLARGLLLASLVLLIGAPTASQGQALQFTATAADSAFGYDPFTGVGTHSQPLLLVELPGSPGFPNEVEGFSFALTFDPLYLVAVGAQPGPAITTLDDGFGPDFFAPIIDPGVFAVGVVLDTFSLITIPVATPQDVVRISFTSNSATMAGDFVGTTTPLIYGDDLGSAVVDNIIVVAGQGYTPAFDDGVVTLVPVPPIVNMQCATTLSEDIVEIIWTNQAVYDSIELRRDGAFLAILPGTATSHQDTPAAPGNHDYEAIPTLLGVVGGGDSCSVIAVPALDGLTCGADVQSFVNSLSWTPPLSPGYDSIRVLREGVEIAVLPGTASGYSEMVALPGITEYSVHGVVAGISGPLQVCTIEQPNPGYVRGDTNQDGNTDIADPIYALNYLFALGPQLCLKSHDSNDDGQTDIADPIYTLAYLFTFGPPIPEPWPVCGFDPTPDFITCDTPLCS